MTSLASTSRKYAETLLLRSASILFALVLIATSSPVFALSGVDLKAVEQDSVHYKVPTVTCGASSIVLSGDSNAAKAFNYFVSQGLESHQAAGIVGNLLGESGLIPNRKQGSGMQTISSASEIVPNVGFGIAQWTSGGRQQAWLDFASKSGKDPLSLELELEYLMHELKTGSYGYKELQSATDLRQATWIFLAYFEKPATVVNAGLANTPTPPSSGPAKDTLDVRISLATKASTSEDSDPTAESTPPSDSCNTPSDTSATTDTKFRLASFNIYYNTDDSNAAYSKQQWQDRLEKSANVIKNSQIDVAGLQEVRQDQWQRLQDTDRLGGTYDIYPSKYGRGAYPGQNPIIWNKTKFELVDATSIPGYTVSGDHGDNVRTQVHLRDKSTQQEFYLINQHDPVGNTNNNPQNRYKSAQELAKHVADLQKKGDPVFMTGDFNSSYKLNPNQRTFNNDRNNLTYCILTADGLTWDSFDAAKSQTGHCPTTDNSTVDHIFMSTSVRASGYDVSNKARENGSDVHPTVFVDVQIPGASDGGAGGGAISADGHTFPLKATRSNIVNHQPTWCYTKTTNCHHDYNAADIFADTGTPVIAIIGGKVVSAKDHDDSSVGSRVTIMGTDGKLYYYAHMGDGTIKVRTGQKVTTGQQLGNVGTAADAIGTTPHLHIDALPGDKYQYRPSCTAASCAGYPFINIQATLVDLFKLVK